jgi:hypothetical protein
MKSVKTPVVGSVHAGKLTGLRQKLALVISI